MPMVWLCLTHTGARTLKAPLIYIITLLDASTSQSGCLQIAKTNNRLYCLVQGRMPEIGQLHENLHASTLVWSMFSRTGGAYRFCYTLSWLKNDRHVSKCVETKHTISTYLWVNLWIPFWNVWENTAHYSYPRDSKCLLLEYTLCHSHYSLDKL